MYLTEILMPVRDNDGHAFTAEIYQGLRDGFSRQAGQSYGSMVSAASASA
jgi:hypothetical protein